MKLSLLSLLVIAAVGASACAAPTGDAAEEPTSSEEALTSLPQGTYAIDRAPYSGSYVSRLKLGAGKKFELEYVRRTTSSVPWFGNPWFQIPTTREEKIPMRGTYLVFEGDRGPMVSFDSSEGAHDSLMFDITVEDGTIRLQAIGGRELVLSRTTQAPEATEKRVLRCQGMVVDAVITLDRDQRRRGTIKMTRTSRADGNDPPNETVEVVYTGDTGVDDYMAFEGTSPNGGGYDFALRKSDLERTSGVTANVGLGYTPELSPGAYHHSLGCTISTR